eukprot:g2655.t1
MKSAKEAGVMVAMKGTDQGKSGWYQDFDGQQYFFAVDNSGVWWQVLSRSEWEKRSEDLQGVPVLVAHDSKKFGMSGKYQEFGGEEDRKKKKFRKWCVKDGIWKRK